jgi:hypothetical protein
MESSRKIPGGLPMRLIWLLMTPPPLRKYQDSGFSALTPLLFTIRHRLVNPASAGCCSGPGTGLFNPDGDAAERFGGDAITIADV